MYIHRKNLTEWDAATYYKLQCSVSKKNSECLYVIAGLHCINTSLQRQMHIWEVSGAKTKDTVWKRDPVRWVMVIQPCSRQVGERTSEQFTLGEPCKGSEMREKCTDGLSQHLKNCVAFLAHMSVALQVKDAETNAQSQTVLYLWSTFNYALKLYVIYF